MLVHSFPFLCEIKLDPRSKPLSTVIFLNNVSSVFQITPAAGLVSILKRRVSLEGANSSAPAPPKPVAKRKVRFREPDEGLDHGKNQYYFLKTHFCSIHIDHVLILY